MLKAGRLGDVLDDLRQRGADVEECRKAAAYLAERRDRMRYDEHLADGLPIGSGIIEAGCKNVVGQRMKCTGMRWSVAGANPVLWLRCARLGGLGSVESNRAACVSTSPAAGCATTTSCAWQRVASTSSNSSSSSALSAA